MKSRKFNVETDYRTVCYWWESHGHGILDSSLLPETGVTITDDNDRMIACSWLYLTNSKCGIIDFTVADPESKMMQRARAIQLAFKQLEEVALVSGVGVIFGFSSHRGFTKTVLRLGYRKEPQGCDLLVKQIAGL